jgi:hypothetical protein
MTCELCGGLLKFLGRLGRLDWFRCEDCGMDFSAAASDEGGYLEYATD